MKGSGTNPTIRAPNKAEENEWMTLLLPDRFSLSITSLWPRSFRMTRMNQGVLEKNNRHGKGLLGAARLALRAAVEDAGVQLRLSAKLSNPTCLSVGGSN